MHSKDKVFKFALKEESNSDQKCIKSRVSNYSQVISKLLVVSELSGKL